jgi:hypothetical protein
MRRFALPQVQAFIAFVHPGLRKTQAGNLCLVIYGYLCCRTPSLSGVARCIPGARRLIHRIKRMDRFINNDVLPREQLAAQLALFNWAKAATKAKPRIIMDYTDLGHGFISLWTAMAYHGRSVPLLSRTMPVEVASEGSRNRAEHEMILQLKALLGTGFILVADRGFARASLLKLLNKEKLDYVIRIDDKTRIHTATESYLAGQIPMGRKRRLWLGLVRYHGTQKVPVRMLICRRKDGRWNLVTSLEDPQLVFQAYFSRMQIEEMFRDLKQHLDIERMRCEGLERRAMWLLLAAIAYSYLYWLGTVAQRAGLSMYYHYWKTESAAWLGVQLFAHRDPHIPKLTRRVLAKLAQTG